MPNPQTTLPKPPPAPAVQVDDRPVMLLGILGFGLSIPWLSGLYGPLGPADGLYWAGMLGFVGLAAAIWLGNRWLLFKQREHLDWFSQPLRKLMMLVVANVLYTAPVTALGLLAWFHAAGLPVNRDSIQVVVLTNVICVLFVTHAYETLFLIRERESDLVRVERLDRLRTQAELAGLKAQVDPHFLFNSLNTLGHLIDQDPARGREFCDTLAQVYRFVLDSRQHDLVPLADELAFALRYHRLLELRFGPSMPLLGTEAVNAGAAAWLVPPMALQCLMENAVKHNRASADEPLQVALALGQAPGQAVVTVANAVRPRRSAMPSTGLGLAQLDERCRLLTGRPLTLACTAASFEVQVPLVARA